MTLTPAQKQALRQKILEANPSLREHEWIAGEISLCHYCDQEYDDRFPDQGVPCSKRPIRLADVLLALHRSDPRRAFACDTAGVFFSALIPSLDDRQTHGTWNLLRDSLDDQSEETLAFLHSLLCS